MQSLDTGFSMIRMADLNACDCDISESLGIVTYNLHGINNGRSMLTELCNDKSVSLIAIQEHLLTSNNLHLFTVNGIHSAFVGIDISAMTNRLEKDI